MQNENLNKIKATAQAIEQKVQECKTIPLNSIKNKLREIQDLQNELAERVQSSKTQLASDLKISEDEVIERFITPMQANIDKVTIDSNNIEQIVKSQISADFDPSQKQTPELIQQTMLTKEMKAFLSLNISAALTKTDTRIKPDNGNGSNTLSNKMCEKKAYDTLQKIEDALKNFNGDLVGLSFSCDAIVNLCNDAANKPKQQAAMPQNSSLLTQMLNPSTIKPTAEKSREKENIAQIQKSTVSPTMSPVNTTPKPQIVTEASMSQKSAPSQKEKTSSWSLSSVLDKLLNSLYTSNKPTAATNVTTHLQYRHFAPVTTCTTPPEQQKRTVAAVVKKPMTKEQLDNFPLQPRSFD